MTSQLTLREQIEKLTRLVRQQERMIEHLRNPPAVPDRLALMFDKQNELQASLGTWEKIESNMDRQAYINQMILALVEEAVEIMRETPYKNPAFVLFGWKKNQGMRKQKALEECVDLFHFLMNIVMVLDFNDEDFFEIYCQKNKVNFKRQQEGY